MTTAATIAARLTLDKSDYDSGLDKAAGQADSFQSKMKSVGQGMSRTGGIMTASVTAPIIAGFGSMISSASNLNESTNAMSVVYGDAGNIISEFGDTSAETIGMAKSDWFQLAAVQGAALKNYGMNSEDAAEETKKLGVRAADMASIFNTDVDSAMAAIGSMMRGEAEPIKRYGVAISENAVQAKLMEMGLGDLEGQELMNAKAQARLALFYEQTNQFAGDFANTSDQLANGSRVLTAQLKDEAAALGAQLLPYVLKGMQFLSGLLDKIKALSPEQQKWIGIILLVVAAIGPLLLIVGSLITAISAIIPVVTAVAGVLTFPLIAIIAAVIAVIALLYLAWQNNWGGIREITASVIQWISDFIEDAMEFITDLTSGQMGEWSEIWDRSTAAIKKIVDLLFANLKLLMAAFKAVFSGDWKKLGEIIRQMLDNAGKGWVIAIKTAWENIKSFFSGAVSSLKAWFAGINWAEVGTNLIKSIASGLTGALPILLAAGKSVFQALGDFLSGFFRGGSTTVPATPGVPREPGERGDAVGTNGWKTVPPGYNDDSFTVGMKSGEQYAVATKNGGLPGGSGTVNYFNPQITILTGKSNPKTAMKGLT